MTTTTFSPMLQPAPALPSPHRLAAWRRKGSTEDSVPALLGRAIRRGCLEWGTAAAPLTTDDILQLFETLRHPLLDQHALTIRLTAESGCLGSLAEVLERADHRHGVEIDLVIDDVDDAEVAALDSESLIARGLFVRWNLGKAVGQSEDEAHVVRHLVEYAVTLGVADVMSCHPETDAKIGRLRLAYALPRGRVGRG